MSNVLHLTAFASRIANAAAAENEPIALMGEFRRLSNTSTIGKVRALHARFMAAGKRAQANGAKIAAFDGKNDLSHVRLLGVYADDVGYFIQQALHNQLGCAVAKFCVDLAAEHLADDETLGAILDKPIHSGTVRVRMPMERWDMEDVVRDMTDPSWRAVMAMADALMPRDASSVFVDGLNMRERKDGSGYEACIAISS